MWVDRENACNHYFSLQNTYDVVLKSFLALGWPDNPLPHNPEFFKTLRKIAFENIVGKGENAGIQHFLPFSPCFLIFQRHFQINFVTYMIPSANAFDLDYSKILSFGKELTLSQANPGFYVQVLWKHCGNRRNYSWRDFSPFPSVFSTCLDNFLPSSSNIKLSSAYSFSLEESKMCRLVKS